jgi:hypothetical protein
MSRFTSYSLGDYGPPGCTMTEENDPDRETYRVVTDARGQFEENRTSYMASGYVRRHHVVSEHGDEESATAACRMFCAIFSTEAWVERELVWGDEDASDDETDILCHLVFDEDTGLVVDA